MFVVNHLFSFSTTLSYPSNPVSNRLGAEVLTYSSSLFSPGLSSLRGSKAPNTVLFIPGKLLVCAARRLGESKLLCSTTSFGNCFSSSWNELGSASSRWAGRRASISRLGRNEKRKSQWSNRCHRTTADLLNRHSINRHSLINTNTIISIKQTKHSYIRGQQARIKLAKSQSNHAHRAMVQAILRIALPDLLPPLVPMLPVLILLPIPTMFPIRTQILLFPNLLEASRQIHRTGSPACQQISHSEDGRRQALPRQGLFPLDIRHQPAAMLRRPPPPYPPPWAPPIHRFPKTPQTTPPPPLRQKKSAPAHAKSAVPEKGRATPTPTTRSAAASSASRRTRTASSPSARPASPRKLTS